ncbi:hypothetical protein [Exiguobacterium chiriqhucha]|uniref:hypothetical protein n=1 Tax=Exiguobacterium chiriqhucha TaxID=1385984 RepID=UPI000736D71A|nr:hypothetical protein [Exiguobacterium chiriqhucha]
MKPIQIKETIKNVKYVLSAQFFSLMLNIVLALIVPKFLGVEDFGYWQLFIFYSGLVGIFHLGLIDGIYLREGGKYYEELNFKSINGQFLVMLSLQFFICLIFFFNLPDVLSDDRKVVLIFTIISIPIVNSYFFLSYILQAVNKIREYTIGVMVDKVFFLVCVIFLVAIKYTSFEPYIIAFVFSKIISIIYLMIVNKPVLFSVNFNFILIFKETLKNIKIGSLLLFSNLSSLMIIGISRFFIDLNLGIELFGIISFYFSICKPCFSFY